MFEGCVSYCDSRSSASEVTWVKPPDNSSFLLVPFSAATSIDPVPESAQYKYCPIQSTTSASGFTRSREITGVRTPPPDNGERYILPSSLLVQYIMSWMISTSAYEAVWKPRTARGVGAKMVLSRESWTNLLLVGKMRDCWISAW